MCRGDILTGTLIIAKNIVERVFFLRYYPANCGHSLLAGGIFD
jgi:hypothetical protein